MRHGLNGHYAVVDDALSPDFPLGDAVETFIFREDAKRSSRRYGATIPNGRTRCGSTSGNSKRAV
jgi:hypothetical protein